MGVNRKSNLLLDSKLPPTPAFRTMDKQTEINMYAI